MKSTARLGRVIAQIIPDVCRYLAQIDSGAREVALGNAGKVQEVVDQRAHVLGGPADTAQIIAACFIQLVGIIFIQNLAKPIHAPERRAKVMGHGVAECFQLAIGRLGDSLGCCKRLILGGKLAVRIDIPAKSVLERGEDSRQALFDMRRVLIGIQHLRPRCVGAGEFASDCEGYDLIPYAAQQECPIFRTLLVLNGLPLASAQFFLVTALLRNIDHGDKDELASRRFDSIEANFDWNVGPVFPAAEKDMARPYETRAGAVEELCHQDIIESAKPVGDQDLDRADSRVRRGNNRRVLPRRGSQAQSCPAHRS